MMGTECFWCGGKNIPGVMQRCRNSTIAGALMIWFILLFSAFFIVIIVKVANAAPPAGQQIDPKIHAWFESLIRADGTHCCGEADCRIAAYSELRQNGDGYQVLIDGQWRDVPPGLIVDREDNPMLSSIICESRGEYTPHSLYCLIPFAGG